MKKTPSRRRLKKTLLAVSAAVLLVAAATVVFIHTAAFKRILMRKAGDFFNKEYGLSLLVRNSGLKPFRLAVSLEGVEVAPLRPGTSPLRAFSAERIFIDAAPSLLFGKIHLQKLEVIRPRVILAPSVKPASSTGKSGGMRAEAGSTPISVRIETLVITQGVLEFGADGYPLRLNLQDIAAGIRYDKKAGVHEGLFKAGNGFLTFADLSLPLDEADLKFAFDDSNIEVKWFRIRSASSALEVTGGIQDFQFAPRFLLTAQGSLQLSDLPLSPETPTRSKGMIDVSGEFRGAGGRAGFSGNLLGKDLTFGDLPVDKFEASFKGDPDSPVSGRFSLETAGGKLEAEAIIPMKPLQPASLSLRWDSIELSRLAVLSRFIPVPLSAAAGGWIKAQLTAFQLDSLDASGEAVFAPGSTGGGKDTDAFLPLRGKLNFDVKKGEVSVKQANFALGPNTVVFSGRFDRTRNFMADFTLDLADPARAGEFLSSLSSIQEKLALANTPPLRLGGGLAISGHVSGNTREPRAEVRLEVRALEINGFVVKSTSVTAALDAAGLEIFRLHAEFEEGLAEGSGRISMNLPSKDFGKKIDLSLKIKGFELGQVSDLPIFRNRGALAGKLDAELEVSGGFSNPRFQLKAGGMSLLVAGEMIDRVEAEASYEKNRLSLKNLLLSKREGTIKAEGGLDLDRKTYNIDLLGDNINLDSLKVVPRTLGGTVSFSLKGEGGLDRPNFSGRLSARQIRVAEVLVPKLEFRAESDGDIMKGLLEIPDIRFSLETDLPLRRPYEVTGRFRFSDSRLDSLLNEGNRAPGSRLLAVLTADGSFSFPVGSREGISGAVNIQRASLAYQDMKLENEQPSSIQLGGGNIRIRDFRFKGSDTEFSLSGVLPFSPSGVREGAMTATGRLNLGILKPFFPAFPVEGSLLFEGEAKGNLDKLQVNAGLKFEGASAGRGTSEVRLAGFLSHISNAPEVEARLSADLDLSLLAPFLDGSVTSGTLSLSAQVRGSLAAPSVEGKGSLRNGYVQIQGFPLKMSDARGGLDIRDSSIILSDFQGVANGGFFKLNGKLEHAGFSRLIAAGIKASIEGFTLSYPEGFFSESNAELSLVGDGRTWAVSGEVLISKAFYRRDIYPGTQLLNAARSRLFRRTEQIPPMLRDVRLDIGIATADPAVIKNNLADMELKANLRISGTLAVPFLSGRIQNTQVGNFVFGERTYVVETARIEFLGADILDPRLDITAHTTLFHRLESLEIRLNLTGTLSDFRYSLSSFPPRSQEEIALLLLTGRSLDEIKGSAVNTLGNQMILYFATPLASPLSRSLKQLLKAEDVVIEPLNIVTEEDPGARFTFRKRVSGRASVTYSADISTTQRQTWLLDYNLSRNFSLRAFRKDNGNYGASFNHGFTLWGGAPPRLDAAEGGGGPRLIEGVILSGDLRYPLPVLEKKIGGLKTGAPFSFTALNKSVENLLGFYRKNGFLNVDIRPETEPAGERRVAITIGIRAGDPIKISFLEDPVPSRIKRKIRESWDGKLPEDLMIEEAKNTLLNELHARDYYDALVSAVRTSEGGITSYSFFVRKGGRYRVRGFEVDGNSALSKRTILDVLKRFTSPKGKGLWGLVYDRRPALYDLKTAYEEHGFLKAVIHPPDIRVDRDSRSMDIKLKIEEGPQSRVGAVEFQGAVEIPADQLENGLSLKTGQVFNSSLLTADRNHILNLYRNKGYRGAEVAAAVVSRPDVADVSIVYSVKEGPQHTISRIEFQGLGRMGESLARKELGLRTGDVLSLEGIALAQKRLYDSGIYKLVNITSEPVAGENGRNRLVVELQKSPMFSVNYGLRFNSEEKLEGFGEVGFANVLGGGRKGLVYYRQNSRQKDLRLSMEAPYMFGLKVNSLLTLYAKEDVLASFVTKETGFSFQQQVKLPYSFSLSYLYRLNKIHTYELEPSGPFSFDISLFLPDVSVYLVRDSRDDKLDAMKGSFFSLGATYSPGFLGSELPFVRMLAQFSFYKPVLPGLIWASNYRIGLADAFDQTLIPGKRFYAGGGNSIRGFRQDRVGPVDPYLDRPEGGNAVLLMSQELRFPLYRWIKGTAFYDMGNVYPSAREITLSEVRQSLGLGLRLESPVGLIRLDYGFNLSRRPGEPGEVFFISIGQAF